MPGAQTRIGTWNLEGKWSATHLRFLLDLECDVLLLTEVRRDLALPGHHLHLTKDDMAANRAWAGICSRSPMEPLGDPHPASAMVASAGATYVSSILPWRSCSSGHPWGQGDVGTKTARVTEQLSARLTPRSVWGGDFNHALNGREFAGSKVGRAHIVKLVDRLGLKAATARLPHRLEPLYAIDHIAVPRDNEVTSARRVDATGLSDHDAYVVTVEA